ncbi:MAG TPA: HNH endonuclease [Terriglobales bacterium]|nr:HNH endonuclease [Terriglobales bacterium]
MADNRDWTRDELLVCFNFYCRTPFGKFHRNNPEIIQLAEALNRTPSAVAMKLSNFASFDPAHQSRNVKGLANASRLDRAVWEEFNANPNLLAQQSEEAYGRLELPSAVPAEVEFAMPTGPTEATATRPMRLVQSFFRRSVLAAYRYSCAFCRIDIPAVLSASHIIPRTASIELRADPRNGLSLCTLHDRAFDRGLMCIDNKLRLRISRSATSKADCEVFRAAFTKLEGKPISLPERFHPHSSSLEYHRSKIFR